MRLMAWELENNFSSRILLFEKHKANLYTKTPAPVLEFLRRDISRVAYEKSNPKSAMFMETARRGMSPAEFFPFLRRRMCALNIALATNHFVDLATAWDLRLNPHFHLRAGMFCSGLALAAEGFYCLKLWRYGDSPADPKKPDNYGDMQILAYVDVCDGIISNDKWMLGVAWACWPKKRDWLLTYDSSSRSLRRFRPFLEEKD